MVAFLIQHCRHFATIVALLLLCSSTLADTSGDYRYQSYDYDDVGRLIRVAPEDGSSIEYLYDATGNRTQEVRTPPPPPVFRLSVTKSGTGIGRVTSTPAGVNCGTTCAADFSAGAAATLTATPAAAATFSGWGGACSGAGVCQVTMSQARTVTATFNSASGWVVIDGRVRLSDGTPICAMVLANGQFMFSCGGNGAYRLNVPLDSNGQITLFAFADGFAPYRWTSGPGGFPRDALMQTAPPGSPTIATTLDRQCSKPGWARIWGGIRAVTGAPLCAMVLANGQHMFSCQPVGSYALTVPLDSQGKITLFGFADGFQPYKLTVDASQCR